MKCVKCVCIKWYYKKNHTCIQTQSHRLKHCAMFCCALLWFFVGPRIPFELLDIRSKLYPPVFFKLFFKKRTSLRSKKSNKSTRGSDLNRINPLQWRHNGLDSVSNHQPRHCLLSRLFGCRTKKTSKLRVSGLCAGHSPETGEFPAQMASNAENVSFWWRHHAFFSGLLHCSTSNAEDISIIWRNHVMLCTNPYALFFSSPASLFHAVGSPGVRTVSAKVACVYDNSALCSWGNTGARVSFSETLFSHGDVMTWKPFRHYWYFVSGTTGDL